MSFSIIITYTEQKKINFQKKILNKKNILINSIKNKKDSKMLVNEVTNKNTLK